MDEQKYNINIKKTREDFESLCKRCGACCGAGDDPCINLKRVNNGSFNCLTYGSHLGFQITISGKAFNCVSIREHIQNETLPKGCGYSNH